MSAAQEQAYQEQIAAGKSHVYARAYALKIEEGPIFARHFAILRERRFLARQKAKEMEAAGSDAADDEEKVARANNDASTDDATAEDESPELNEGDANNPTPSSSSAREPPKRSAKDFTFHKVLGEGSFSTVFLATEKDTSKEFAIKVVDKAHVTKHDKTKYVMIEKKVFSSLDHPFIVPLYYTFHDPKKLYFVLGYCSNGELLKWIRKLGSFDEDCTRFYTAEIISALEHMHNKGIIHRDLKPENILMNHDMHIQLTDFGTAKILADEEEHANSFVGTAQYVSPELLTHKTACKSSDLWAVGCIMYQLLAGSVPFRGGNEYQTFKKITALEYSIPEGFPDVARDLVEGFLKLDPNERLGSEGNGGFEAIKAHPFFTGTDWDKLASSQPPKLDAYLPARTAEDRPLHANDAGDDELADIQAAVYMQSASPVKVPGGQGEDRRQLLDKQKRESPWQRFLNDDELIVKSGLVDKRKGLFSKRRQLILTDAPRLIYIDPETMEQKGEMPWSDEMYPQFKNMKTFFVHTPNRTYYLEDVERTSITWVDTIQQLLRMRKHHAQPAN